MCRFFSRTTQQPSLIHCYESYQSVYFNNQVFFTDTFHLPATSILYKWKNKELLPLHHHLLICFYIIIFATEKIKTAKDIFDKKALAIDIPATNTSATTSLIFQILKAKKSN